MAGRDTSQKVAYLIERARTVKMTPAQVAEQRRSFAFGNAAFENTLITREMIEEEDRRLGLDNDDS